MATATSTAQVQSTTTTLPRKPLTVSKKRQYRAAYVFVLPFFIVFLAMIIVPLGYAGYLSFFKQQLVGGVSFAGFDNYVRALTDPTIVWGSWLDTTGSCETRCSCSSATASRTLPWVSTVSSGGISPSACLCRSTSPTVRVSPRSMNPYLDPIVDRLRGTRLEPFAVDIRARVRDDDAWERVGAGRCLRPGR